MSYIFYKFFHFTDKNLVDKLTFIKKSVVILKMSHPYGAHSSQGMSTWTKDDDYNQRHQSGPSGMNRGRGSARGRKPGSHPPHLKGAEIGLYYRDRARRFKKKQDVLVITLPPFMKRRIKDILENVTIPQGSEGSQRDSWNCEFSDDSASEFESKYTYINESQFKRNFVEIVSGSIQQKLNKAILDTSKLQRSSHRDQKLLDELKLIQSKPEYEKMKKFRIRLPAYDRKEDILELIRNNQIVVISGETGCGKTTQVGQFILDNQIEAGNGSITKIVCTQPRRISAISVADRVAAERVERLGESVGFQIRLEKVPPRDYGSILFCTTGILLQYMRSDPALKEFSHIILDEIHERNTECDFIIALLKQIAPKRPDLKIILMSATLNSERFSIYFNNCPMTHIPGFTYPVKEYYLEDILEITQFKFPENTIPTNSRKYQKIHKSTQNKSNDLLDIIQPHIRQLLAEGKYSRHVTDQLKNPKSEELNIDLVEEVARHICKTKGPGAILIFLPGITDIVKLSKKMLENGHYPHNRYIIYPLHSRMPTIDQKLIFKEPPEGVRKIIIATSIAETSITIEDVVYVINCGKMKLSNFDVDRNIQTLQPEWVTLANSKQRKGRAGRVKPGFCYHLYSKARELTLDQYPLPEMLRTRLENVILQIKILQLGKAKPFLAEMMDPPNPKSIDLSIDLLQALSALDSEEQLTPLGYHLAQLPLDPRTGKMIIWAAMFSCIQPIFAIAASLTFKDAFYVPLGMERQADQKKLELSMNQFSDHIALAEALMRYEQAFKSGNAYRFCREYFLSYNTLKLLSEMKTQFAQHLYEMKFLENENPNDRSANKNSNNMALIKAIVCVGLYPNIAVVRNVNKHGVRAWTPEDGRVLVHPSSVNEKVQSFPSPYLTYFVKQKSTSIFLHDTTCVSEPILLFADSNNFLVRERSCSFVCEHETAEIIQKLREQFNKLLEYKISHPGTVDWSSFEGQILNAIIEFVSQRDD
ncbi:ATP-dependent DNA/RNA helicase DHX36 [Prorops nasuta]|uniref:ATP-dependent DNA/RNA helicase DHX36 n=1 Tax=Prorops nasuta TaxID=863751 RepID=UPI0034CD40AA